MVRFLLAFALIGTFAAAHPVLADSVTGSSQAATHVPEHPAQPAAAEPTPDAAVQTDAGIGKGVAPVGFGWG